jgi:hypothetical protein
MKINKKSILIILFIFALATSFWSKKTLAEDLLVQRVIGKILLQVEAKGEAWYVSPIDLKRYYLGRPDDAFIIMKTTGVGITNTDIQKIPVADLNLTNSSDIDDDGLSDTVETAFGTNKEKADTDDDGYGDKEEVLKGFNPNKAKEMTIDTNFSAKQKGKILIQVQSKGEAWYVSHKDNKRYFLGRPQDSFNIMRTLGLGITNTDLSNIEEFKPDPEFSNETIVKNNTTPSTVNNTSLVYNDLIKKFSFEYPKNWQIKKFKETPDLIQISDASRDFIMEKRGVITVNYLKTEEDYNVEIFAVAQKDGVITLSNKKIGINYKEAYENSYDYPVAHEKTITIKLSSNEFLRLSLVTSKSNIQYYDAILDKLVESVKR